VGCYSSSPLKQNLVPRFLSVEVRGGETKLELGLNGCSSNSPVKSELQQGIAFAEGVDRLHLVKLIAEELMLPKVSCQNLVGTPLRLVGLDFLVRPKKILRELGGSQLTIEVLKGRGFPGSSCWLGVALSLA
jgi:hypothetical protein